MAGTAIFGDRQGVIAAMKRLRALRQLSELNRKMEKLFMRKRERYATRNDRSWPDGRQHGAAA